MNQIFNYNRIYNFLICWTKKINIFTCKNNLYSNNKYLNKPLQGGFGFLFPFLLFNTITYKDIMVNMGISLTYIDPFIFNLCSLYVTCCQVCCLFTIITIGLGLCGMFNYIYTYKLKFLKTIIDNNKNLKWGLNVVVVGTLSYIFIGNMHALYGYITQAIDIIKSNHIQHFYYNPPGLAMGTSRVLHIAEYSWPLNYIERVLGFDLNPRYLLNFISFVKTFYLWIIIVICYMLIACLTTGIYSQDKMALSLPGGPATLNLITKCFYIKNPYKLYLILVLITLMLIWVSYLLYIYINIYVIG